ncbi:MAG: hypothetical protein HC818_06965 [Synechococcaceae cyanobacterium RM1_1_27]|nr:hypothetical protein [Synechococcaceae cyanobacterium SM2_3_2]NJO86291.1 hypothetical protein [Synechococcaceae cyanobacterium RM1_1_27]
MELDQVKAIVDKAMADGKLSRQEIDQIMDAVMADNKVSIGEMELLEMIENKILNQEVDLD